MFSIVEEVDDTGANGVISESDALSDPGNQVIKNVAELQSRSESRSDTITTATPGIITFIVKQYYIKELVDY